MKNTTKLQENLINWLSEQYDEQDARVQIVNANITINKDVVSIVYDNGVEDIVVVDENLNILSQIK